MSKMGFVISVTSLAVSALMVVAVFSTLAVAPVATDAIGGLAISLATVVGFAAGEDPRFLKKEMILLKNWTNFSLKEGGLFVISFNPGDESVDSAF